MPFDLKKIREREVEIKITFLDETLTLAYWPGKLTLDVLEQMQGDGTDLEKTKSVLPKLISRWDMMNGKGKPEPITPETFGQLESKLVGRISGAIMEDMFPNATTTETSGSF